MDLTNIMAQIITYYSIVLRKYYHCWFCGSAVKVDGDNHLYHRLLTSLDY